MFPASKELEIVIAMLAYSVLQGSSARLIDKFAGPATLAGRRLLG